MKQTSCIIKLFFLFLYDFFFPKSKFYIVAYLIYFITVMKLFIPNQVLKLLPYQCYNIVEADIGFCLRSNKGCKKGQGYTNHQPHSELFSCIQAIVLEKIKKKCKNCSKYKFEQGGFSIE